MDELTIDEMIRRMEKKINQKPITPKNRIFYDLLTKVDKLYEFDFIIIEKLLQMDKNMQSLNEPFLLSHMVNEIFLSAGQLQYSLVLKTFLRWSRMIFIFNENSDGVIELVPVEKYEEILSDDSILNIENIHFGNLLSNFRYKFYDDDYLLDLDLNRTVVELILKIS